jgi:ABC-type amino acid transport substrate-binding protein
LKPENKKMKKLTLISCTLGLLLSHSLHASEAPLQGTLKKVADSGSITLGYRDASVPFSYVGDNTGKPMGYSVELASRWRATEGQIQPGDLANPDPAGAKRHG